MSNGGEVQKAYVLRMWVADQNKSFDSSIDHSNYHQLDLTKLSKGAENWDGERMCRKSGVKYRGQ